MNAQDLGKALIGLFGGGLALFLLFGAFLLKTPETPLPSTKEIVVTNGEAHHDIAHTQKSNPSSICLASTVALFWLMLILYLSSELRKAGGVCAVPCPCFTTLFGFLLFWAFLAFVLDYTHFFKEHHYMAPLSGIYFVLSALLLFVYWLSTAPAESKAHPA